MAEVLAAWPRGALRSQSCEVKQAFGSTAGFTTVQATPASPSTRLLQRGENPGRASAALKETDALQAQPSALTDPLARLLSRSYSGGHTDTPWCTRARKAPKGVAATLTESWTASDAALAAAAAVEAMTLARAAAKAAEDAMLLADTWVDDEQEMEDFLSEKDLLMLERARLREMEQASTDAELLSEGGRGHFSHLGQGLNGLHLSKDETRDTNGRSPESDGNVVVRSTRRKERLRKRERAQGKAEKVAAEISRKRSGFSKVRKSALGEDAGERVRGCIKDMCKKRLLTMDEEAELSRGIQDLMHLDVVKKEVTAQLGREPSLQEWANAAGMQPAAFETRLMDGQECKDKMIVSNLRLVVSMARNYVGRGLCLQDLIQEGSMGLIRGAEKFDCSKGFKFSTYAHWWIRQALNRAVSEQSRTIRLPVHMYEVLVRINKARRTISQHHERPPRDEEVAEMLGMGVDKIKLITRSAKMPQSMEKPIGKDHDDRTLGDILGSTEVESAAEEAISQEFQKQHVNSLLDTLDQREREILKLRYGLEDGKVKTLEEIGNVFNVTRERIRQIEGKAMRKLKQRTSGCNLHDYVRY